MCVFVGKDLFGAEPFDPFTCGAADFPPDIQSKLDEMQVSVPPHWAGSTVNPSSPVCLIVHISTLKLKKNPINK